jgi:5-(carboxyamino)imidazole ribonucleotide synthase
VTDPTAALGFPRVGVVGGGQLARMLVGPAEALGIGLRVLANSRDEAAAQVIPDVVLGSPDDADALRDLAVGCAVITFDHEHVPPAVLRELTDAGFVLRPAADALAYVHDKITMRRALDSAGVPVPRWTVVIDPAEVDAFAADVGWPVVLKTSRGGYDGKAVWVVADSAEVVNVLAMPLPENAEWLVEECVAFTQELSAQVARSPSGQAVAYPVVRTVQTNGICTEVISPAPGLLPEHAVAAQELALHLAGELGVVGMLAVELFDTHAGVLVNELAMRPHNSGHWSIEGAATSQFENHLRAVLDLPLGSPAATAKWSVMVNVLGGDYPDLYAAYLHVMARDPGLHVHVYGKEVRPGRKVGHVTACGDDLDDLLRRAHHAADYLTGTITE